MKIEFKNRDIIEIHILQLVEDYVISRWEYSVYGNNDKKH